MMLACLSMIWAASSSGTRNCAWSFSSRAAAEWRRGSTAWTGISMVRVLRFRPQDPAERSVSAQLLDLG